MYLKRNSIILGILALSLLISSHRSHASPISEEQAKIVATNWLSGTQINLDDRLGREIKEIIFYKDGASGTAGYYLFILSPSGWVLVPAEDQYWPIMAFGNGKMERAIFEKSFWYDITSVNTQESTVTTRVRQRWQELLSETSSKRAVAPQNSFEIVPSLLTTEWDQEGEKSFAALTTWQELIKSTHLEPLFFDPETHQPPYPVGCVPLAIAQLMTYLLRDILRTVTDGSRDKSFCEVAPTLS